MGLRQKFINWLNAGVDEEYEEQDNEESCGCDHDERAVVGHQMTPDQEREMMDNWVPVARYCIRASGLDYWVDDWKPGPMGAIDVMWIQKIGGEDKTVVATLFENSFTIVDYQTPMTQETFTHIKNKNLDFVMQMAEEQKLVEDAKKEAQKQNSKPPVDVNFAAYS